MDFTYSMEPLEGTLRAYKRYVADGSIEEIFHEKNLIMLASKQYLLSAIYAAGVSFQPISQLAVGIGGTVDPEGLFPKPVTQQMTALYNELTRVNTSYTVNSAVPSVTFIADLDQGTGNSALITEAGLFRTGGAMFNIKTFPGIPKTSEFSLHFEWTIKIA